MGWFSDVFSAVTDVVSSVVDTAGDVVGDVADAAGSVVDTAGDVVGDVVTPENAAIAAAIYFAQPELAAFASTTEGAAALSSFEGAAALTTTAEGAATVWSVADTIKATATALKYYRDKERADSLDKAQRAYEDRRMALLNRQYNAPTLLSPPTGPANPNPYDLSAQMNPRASTLPEGYQPPPVDNPKVLISPTLGKAAAVIVVGVALLLWLGKNKAGS